MLQINSINLDTTVAEDDSLGIVQEIEVWSYEQMLLHKIESILKNETHKIQ